MDYLAFMHGLTFAALAVTVFGLARLRSPRLPWGWLCAFGVLHALNAWLGLFALSVGDLPVFSTARLIVLMAAFLSLLEFSRAALTRSDVTSQRWRWCGRWIFVPWLAVVLASTVAGSSGLHAGIRYMLGLPGVVWAGATLWRYRRLQAREVQNGLRLTIGAVLAYALATSPTVLVLSLMPAQAYVVLRVVQILVAVLMTVGLWQHYQAMCRWLLRGYRERKSALYERWVVIALVVVVATGWLATIVVTRYTEREQRALLAAVAETLSTGLDTKLCAMTAKDDAQQRDACAALRQRLIDLHHGVERLDIRWIYLMRQERGDIVLVAGSTPETSPDYAPPNTPYNDAPSEIAQVFGDANTHVVGPYTDRWGTFVSAYVRVPATAGTAYVLGMDVNADHWFRKVRLNRLAPIVIVILMALLVLVFVVLQQSNIETRDVLQESQRMLTTLMGNLPGMAYRCSNDTRWTMTFVSGGCQALTGYSPAELLNDRRVTYAEIIKADHRQRVWDKVQQAVAKRRAYELTYPIIRSDGSERWVWERGRAVHGADGTILSLEGFITDINERHQAEEALRESEKRFRTLFEQSPDAIFVEDNHGRVLDANPAACRLHGVTREQLLATPVTDLVPPEDRVNFNDQFRNVVDGTWRHFESRSYTVDKRTVPVDVHVSRITYGGAPGLLFHVRDISERVRVEEERRALEAQAQQTQKLESLGVLAGGIAHDFNNLLMAILGNVELALRLVSSTAQERLHLYEIEKTAHRAADLCRQMLAYAGRGRFMLEQLNLNDLIVDMQQIFAVACSKKARLEYQLASEVPAIVGDATQVRQVVMNLVINAAEALGDAAGIITIRTGIHKGTVENDDIYLMPLEAVKDTPCIVVEVSDTGCGMDDETKSKMFDPFFSTKLVGRGLGLAAVQGIMRGHRGAVTVCSEVGVGTRFRLYFPVAQQMVTPTCKTQSPSTWRGAGLVLLVDDEAAIRVAGARMLEVLGFTTVVAANGREAIEVFQRHAEHLRCVVLDLTMPLMDGVETFDELRRIRPAVAIIVASGYGEQDVAPRFAGRCLSGFVQKPYSLETLKTVLRAALEHTTPSSST